jgi:hypothetical protein
MGKAEKRVRHCLNRRLASAEEPPGVKEPIPLASPAFGAA